MKKLRTALVTIDCLSLLQGWASFFTFITHLLCIQTNTMDSEQRPMGDASLIFDSLDIDLVVKVLNRTAFSTLSLRLVRLI